MAELTVFVPTRGRPGQLVDFASTFDQTKTGDTEVVFIFDEDDPEVRRYVAKNAGRWKYYVGPPTKRGMVGALNAGWRHYRDSGDLGRYIGFMGDDHRPRTVGWDTSYQLSLQEVGFGFVYGNDLLQGREMPTQVAFSSGIAEALGYMCPPQLDHLCVDLVWRELGKRIDGLVYLDDVIVEHMHPLAGKGVNDKNYRAVNSNLIARHDNAAYHEYMEQGAFEEDVARLKMYMENGYVENRWDNPVSFYNANGSFPDGSTGAK